VAAEKGFRCSLYDINPFLVWFGNTKSANYPIKQLKSTVDKVEKDIIHISQGDRWLPPIKNIDRWWDDETLSTLSDIRYYLSSTFGEPSNQIDVRNLLWVSFARVCIEVSAADFSHVSVSFNDNRSQFDRSFIINLFIDYCKKIFASAERTIIGESHIYLGDSRELPIDEQYDLVITSPPYPNRISYIRELRPYMYWLKFLSDSKDAGELDWKAIGGTWGSATSKLMMWNQQSDYLPSELLSVCSAIASANSQNGETMSRYVHKFFDDIYLHLSNLRKRLNDDAQLNYIIGNSFFYDIEVDTESYLIDILQKLGYTDIHSSAIRKRNSKKGLYEYLISARWKV